MKTNKAFPFIYSKLKIICLSILYETVKMEINSG